MGSPTFTSRCTLSTFPVPKTPSTKTWASTTTLAMTAEKATPTPKASVITRLVKVTMLDSVGAHRLPLVLFLWRKRRGSWSLLAMEWNGHGKKWHGIQIDVNDTPGATSFIFALCTTFLVLLLYIWACAGGILRGLGLRILRAAFRYYYELN